MDRRQELKNETALWLAIILIGILGGFTIRLSIKLGEIKINNNQLETQIANLNTTVDDITSERDKLLSEVTLLKEDNTSLLIENDNLQEEITKLELASETNKKLIDNLPHNNYAVINLDDEERDLLARILALEAGDQPDCGQRAVIEVVFNRVLTGWASTVKGVLLQSGQFSTVKYLDNPYQVPDEKEYANIDWVLAHGSSILPEDYVFFATYKANGTDFIHIQDHFFGRE